MKARITLSNPDRYKLAAAIATPLGAVSDPETQSITVAEPLASLVRRIATGEAAVLPVRRSDHDEWLVVGATRHDLDTALAGVGRFVVPTYAEYEGAYPLLRAFDPGAEALHGLCSAVYQPASTCSARPWRTSSAS